MAIKRVDGRRGKTGNNNKQSEKNKQKNDQATTKVIAFKNQKS